MEKKPVKFVPTGGDPHNSIASLLKVLASVTFIGGFFGGIAVGDTVVPLADLLRNKADEFQFGYALAVWFSAFVLGALLLGASELLSILQLHQTQSYIPCEYDPETDAPDVKANAPTPEPEAPATAPHAAAPTMPVAVRYDPKDPSILICPVCNKAQPANRRCCYFCNATFFTTETEHN